MALLILAVLWLGAVGPLLDWHTELSERLAQRAALARRMAQVADALPDWERRVAEAAAAEEPTGAAVMAEPTDAVAGAALQQVVQDLARQAGATLASAEVLPAEPAGPYRRIGLRVGLQAPWPVLVGLMRLLSQPPGSSPREPASRLPPRMVVDDLRLHAAFVLQGRDDPPLEASFTVVAFRRATAP